MRTLPSLVFTILAVFCTTANAQLNKCTGADGKVSYQSEPCPVTSKASTVRPPTGPSSDSSGIVGADKGWDSSVLESMRNGCITSGLRETKAQWDQTPGAGPFPMAEWRASAEAYCGCLVNRVRTSITPDEFVEKGANLMVRYTGESLAGGPCKPTGIMARSLGY